MQFLTTYANINMAALLAADYVSTSNFCVSVPVSFCTVLKEFSSGFCSCS